MGFLKIQAETKSERWRLSHRWTWVRACGCMIDNVTEMKALCSSPYPAASILFLLPPYCILHCIHSVPLSKCQPLCWFHNPQFEKHRRLLPKFWFPSVCFKVSQEGIIPWSPWILPQWQRGLGRGLSIKEKKRPCGQSQSHRHIGVIPSSTASSWTRGEGAFCKRLQECDHLSHL